MNDHPETRRRRLSAALIRHATSVMPPTQQHWADAMRNELAYMADDREALRWAIGCFVAALLARIRELCLLDVPGVRAMGVLLASFNAFGAVFPTALTMAYRWRAFGTTERLGQMTAGDDVNRLVPLMEAIPWWIHTLSVVGAACYLTAVVCLIWRRRLAHAALLLGMSIDLALRGLMRPIVADVGVVPVPNESLLSAVLLPFVLPSLLAFAAWTGSRSDGIRKRL